MFGMSEALSKEYLVRQRHSPKNVWYVRGTLQRKPGMSEAPSEREPDFAEQKTEGECEGFAAYLGRFCALSLRRSSFCEISAAWECKKRKNCTFIALRYAKVAYCFSFDVQKLRIEQKKMCKNCI